jgi:putative membrane protein
MSESQVAAVKKHKSLGKGLIAGLIGGLAGTAVQTFAERIFTPLPKHATEPQELAAECIAGNTLTALEKARQSEAFRWGLGAVAGAAYGAVAEFYPEATVKQGAGFGLALEAMSHEIEMSALGLAAHPAQPNDQDNTLRDRGSEITSFVVYGVTTEMVRRLMRRWL